MKREEQRVLAGSLNVLPPSDKTPDNDAIDLFNFRVDQVGVLRGGDTFTSLALFGDGTAAIHTIVKLGDIGSVSYVNSSGVQEYSFPAGAFLVGAGTSLYYCCAPYTGDGYPVQIATGFDGNPLSIVIWNGFIWVMNQAKQIAIQPVLLGYGEGASAVFSWLPVAPTTACTATDDPTFYGSMSDSAGVQYFVTFSNDYVTDGVSHTEESGNGPVSAEATPAEGYMTLSNLPLPGTSPNGFGLSRTIYRQGGTLPASYSLPPAGVNYATGNIGTTYLDQYTDSYLMANGHAWNPSAAAGPNAPSAPSVAPTLTPGYPPVPDSGFTGNSYVYYVTFVAITGLETNPGPASASVTPSEGQVQISNLPTTDDPSVYAWRLYREGGTLGAAYQVAQITMTFSQQGNPTLQSAVTYLDSQTDLALTELGIEMPGEDLDVGANDPPPAALGLVGPYFNYLLAFNGNRMWWSQDGIPLFPGSALNSAEGNWVNVGQADDHILSITLHSQVAIIHKQRSIWRLVGDPVEGFLAQTSSAIGAGGRNCVANAGSFDLVLNNDGLWLFDLDAEHKQSQKLDPIFMGTHGWTGLGASDLTGYPWTPTLPVCAYLSGIALLSDGHGTAFLFHAETQRFAALSVVETGVAITAVCPQASAWNYYIGTSDGYLWQANQQSTGMQTYVWQTRFLDQGLGDQQKIYDEIALDLELNGCEATVHVLFDDTAAAVPLADQNGAVFTGTSRQKYYIALQQNDAPDLPQAYPHISVRVAITGSTTGPIPPAIHGLYIYWSLEPRDINALDSQIIDWQSDFVSIARKVAVNVLGEVQLTISTDEPGGIGERFQKIVGTAGVRQWIKFNLPPNVRGRLWRIQAQSIGTGAAARLYSVRAWMRKTGTAGEEAWSWQSWLEGNPPAEIPDAP